MKISDAYQKKRALAFGYEPLQAALEIISTGKIDVSKKISAQEKKCLARQVEVIKKWNLAGGITGFGIGPKIVLGKQVDHFVCRIYVKSKKPKSRIGRSFRIPQELCLEGFEKPIGLDVVELGYPEHSSLYEYHRPIFAGMSVGHSVSGKTGTIGAFIKLMNAPDDLFILSASHVIAVSGLGKLNDSIIQPGPEHGGKIPEYTIGYLYDHIALKEGAGYINDADAAIARLKKEIEQTNDPYEIFGIADSSLIKENKTILYKTGCRSGSTPIQIVDIHYRGSFMHPARGGGRRVYNFKNLLLYKGLSLDGDSGGPILTEDGLLVGIHMGMESIYGVGTPIWNIQKKWNFIIN